VADLIPYRDENSGTRIPDGGLKGGFESAHTRNSTEFVGIREYFGIVRRHLWITLGIVALSVIYTVNQVMKAPPLYRAAAVVRLVDARGAVTGGLDRSNVYDDGQFSRMTDALESQIQVLQSRAVAAAAVDLKGLRLIPSAGQPFVDEIADVKVATDASASTARLAFGPSTYVLSTNKAQSTAPYGQPVSAEGVTVTVVKRPAIASAKFDVVSEDAAAAHALGGFSANVREKTDVIDLSYTGSEPREVRRVVNAMAEGFQAQNASSAQQQSRRRRVFIEGQLKQTDSLLSKAVAAYAAYRSGRQVFSSSGKANAQEAGLVTIDMRRAELDAERNTYQMLLAQAEKSQQSGSAGIRALISSPGIASNPVVLQLADQLTSLEKQRDTLIAAGAAPSNPDVVSITALIPSTTAKILDAVRSQIESIQARIASLDRLRAAGATQVAAAPAGEGEEDQLKQNVANIQEMAGQLQQELQKAKIAEAVEAGQVELVDLPTSPGYQIATGNQRKVLLGILVGLILGIGAAIVLDTLNDSIRRRSDIEKLLKVPSLAVIPRIQSTVGNLNMLQKALPHRKKGGRPLSPTRDGDLVTITDVGSSGAEAFRTLRTNLMYSQAVKALRTLVITSAAPSEGKSLTAANIAVSLSQQGLRVLLIDLDLRRARLHRMFRVSREPGMTELVLGTTDQEKAIHPTLVTGLYLLTSGKLPPNPSELIGGDNTRRVLESLAEGFDVLILDTPPLLAASDAAVLGTLVDGVILVLRAGSTDISAAQQSMEQLKAVGARVVGAVLNDPDTKVPEYGAYYRYEYEYSTTADDVDIRGH
jgi:succinoglycan biosynthesis transport protein ExoP